MSDRLSVQEWANQRCRRTAGPATSTADLHVAYLEHGGEDCTAPQFGVRLTDAGFPTIRRAGKSFRALAVDDAEPDEPVVEADDPAILAAYSSYRSGDAEKLKELDTRTMARLRHLFELDLQILIEEEGLAQTVEIAGSDGAVRSKIQSNPRAEQLIKLAQLLGLGGPEQQMTPRSKTEKSAAEEATSMFREARDWLDKLRRGAGAGAEAD